MAGPLILAAPGARLEISPDDGGRMRSLTVDGRELLLTEGYGPVMWGCYPMAPWAGRIRNATFRFAGRDHRLTANAPPHALHGTVFDRPWAVTGPASVGVDLGTGWPFRGSLEQSFALDAGSLRVTMTLRAEEPMPAVIGWHPWFRRRLDPDADVARLHVAPARMYAREADGITSGRLVAPGPRPWDDCFVGLAAPPELEWPGILRLRISSDLDHWVVYDEQPHALCVEPQSGPPDGPNLAPRVVGPDAPLAASMTWQWWTPGEEPPGPA